MTLFVNSSTLRGAVSEKNITPAIILLVNMMPLVRLVVFINLWSAARMLKNDDCTPGGFGNSYQELVLTKNSAGYNGCLILLCVPPANPILD